MLTRTSRNPPPFANITLPGSRLAARVNDPGNSVGLGKRIRYIPGLRSAGIVNEGGVDHDILVAGHMIRSYYMTHKVREKAKRSEFAGNIPVKVVGERAVIAQSSTQYP